MLIEKQNNFTLHALTDCAVVLEISGEKIIVVADLHLGKSASFRAHGLAVPEGDTLRDLARLEKLISKNQAERLIVAGDLFHADSGFTDQLLDTVLDFIKRIEIPFLLISGNHDDKIQNLPEDLRVAAFLELGTAVRIVHKPEHSSPALFNICGHVHPILRIRDGRKTSIRLPCFYLRKNVLTLPPFGSFTGGQIVKAEQGDRFFVTHQDAVIEVPDELLR